MNLLSRASVLTATGTATAEAMNAARKMMSFMIAILILPGESCWKEQLNMMVSLREEGKSATLIDASDISSGQS